MSQSESTFVNLALYFHAEPHFYSIFIDVRLHHLLFNLEFSGEIII